jgi:hypothetical protein
MNKFIILLFIILSILFACSEDSGTNSVDAEFAPIYSEILSLRCAKSGCHLDSHPYLNMQDAAIAYTQLLNRPSSVGFNYIKPGSPDSSYLYIKILPENDGLALGRQGARMPYDGMQEGYLPTSQIETIREWILAGAPNN